MKQKKNTNHEMNAIPDLDIIDLDLEPVESLLDAPEQAAGLPKEEPAPEPSLSADAEEAYSEAAADELWEELTDSETESEESEASFDPDYQEDDSWVTEDWTGDRETGEEGTAPKKSFLSRINWHIMFGLAVLVIIGLAGYRIFNYGIRDSLDNYEGNYDAEVLDSIMPLFLPDGAQPPVDDGVTTIVAFGNAPFADDMDSGDSLAHMIEDMTGAVVYNCAVADSYLAADAPTLSDTLAPMDAFSFYWLTTAFCLRNNAHVYESIFAALGDNVPANGREAYETLVSLDFSTVDVIVLMYDGSDYLAGHYMYNDDNDTDIQQFTGNMTAGIDLIKEYYPHIRIIVMSPTYAFAVNEEGEYVSSDQYRYNDQDVLSTYVIKQFQYAYDRSVTFVDNLYGTVTEDNASEYLIDNLHLNTEGRRLVAERFVYALNYYTTSAENQAATQ